MAFKLFKKKEVSLPTEEKAEILDTGFPDVSPLPPMMDMDEHEMPDEMPPSPMMPQEPEFHTIRDLGFRSPDELRPPITRPKEIREMISQPTPQQIAFQPFRGEEEPQRTISNPNVFGAIRSSPRLPVHAPHIYIRVNKYKEVIEALENLKTRIHATKNDLEEIHEIGVKEGEKLKDAATVILQIEELLRYLETTFTSPEE